jgi:WD40 repeat protein
MLPTAPLRHGLVWGVLALVASPAAAQPKAPPKLDLFGDPLPAGAVARFGSNRWRNDGSVIEVRYVPGGDLLTVGENAVVRLWNGATGQENAGHPLGVGPCHVAASADGRFVVASNENGVWLWDRAQAGPPLLWRETEYRTLANDFKIPIGFDAAGISPDGKWIAAARGPGVRVWERATQKLVYKTRFADDPQTLLSLAINCIAFSPDSRFVAFLEGIRIVVVEHQTGNEVRLLEGHAREVTRLVFSPDGRMLASGSLDETLCVWEWASGKVRCRFKAGDGACAFSSTGRLLAFEDAQGSIQIWNLPLHRQVRTLPGLLTGVMDVCFSPDDAVLAVCGEDSAVHRWDVATGQRLGPANGHTAKIYGLSVSPDQRSLASCGVDDTVRIWDLATAKETACLQGHTRAVYAVAWSPDGTKLASTGRDRTVRVWDVASKQLLTDFKLVEEPWLVAFSAGGTKLVTCGAKVRLWDAANGKELVVVGDGPAPCRGQAGSADGNVFAWANSGGIALWGIDGGKQRRPLSLAETERGDALAMSPDARWIAVLHNSLLVSNPSVVILDAVSGKVHHTIRLPSSKGVPFVATCLTSINKGPGVVCGGTDGRLWVWSGPQTKALLTPTAAGAGEVLCLAAVGDGRHVVSGHANGTALMWDVEALAKGQKLDPGPASGAASARRACLARGPAQRRECRSAILPRRGGLFMSANARDLVEAQFHEALEHDRAQEQRLRGLVEQFHRQAAAQVPVPAAPADEPPSLSYTELPGAQPGSRLCQEWNYYRREVARLLAEGKEGRFVLIKGQDILGIWDTRQEAKTAALARCLMQPCLIHQIRSREPLLRDPTRPRPCRG